jgi:acyl carrier protein phosphodiesterase
MNMSKTDRETPQAPSRLRNFDLSVDEIRLVKTINEMTNSVKKIEQMEPNSPRAKFIRIEIQKLEEQLEDLRDNTLIR